MQGQRAPGIDGLTVEFYKAFWDILAADDILDVFNESLTYGSMPVSCRRAVLTLLPPKGNLQDIKNWRPVSLLCVDYKLLSKAFSQQAEGSYGARSSTGTRPTCVPGSKRNDKPNSLHWLLKEPLIVHGARLDISSSVAPGLTGGPLQGCFFGVVVVGGSVGRYARCQQSGGAGEAHSPTCGESFTAG
ncbi:hypothetical protein L3Q82_001464 [Scortum barcoo]|uniref:Uncharacterized protein n=1 Tax=Scortum barcoo TaxID=214431 RepID=A0ACB8W9D2_9TELE|nr:hypothetical protein L3Q82_001464 [Scortum barcoo]